ncbi:MAG: HlyD family type I secretion periplasmic adaptor subunit [Rhodospirillales bacterium]|nr:HlyD family type I secretion periplasmic adaptor subunit [Rhodospirillales bacterium]
MSIFSSRRSELDRTIGDFQSETQEIEGRADPAGRRITLYLTSAMLVTLVAWASVAKIDKVVAARGKLVSTAPAIMLQPLDTAIIRTIQVKPGETVKAGQVLATLDATFTQADLGQLTGQLNTLSAQIERLESELAGKPFQPKGAAQEVVMQASLWQSRDAQYRAQLQSFDERVSRLTQSLVSRKRERELLASRLSNIVQVEEMRRELQRAQVGSRLQVLAANAERLEVERNLSMLTNQAQELQHELDDTKAQREAFAQKWRNDIGQELVQRRTERANVSEQVSKARKREELVTLTAPVDAMVLEVTPLSVTSIVKQAEPVIKLAPLNAPLEVQADIDGSEIGFVREGDPVFLKLDAYNFFEHGSALGVVRVISDDSFSTRTEGARSASGANALTQQQGVLSSGGLVYRARIELTNTTLRNVPESFRLMPGLPLTAEIKVGTRTIMSYLLRPLLSTLGEGMREP